MKLKFTKSTAMNQYHDVPPWTHGEVRDVDERTATGLLNHPEFTPADGEAKDLAKRLAEAKPTATRIAEVNGSEGTAPKPSGDPSTSEGSSSKDGADGGDGADLSGLSSDERAAYTRAQNKIADGKGIDSFTELERAVFDKVQSAEDEE